MFKNKEQVISLVLTVLISVFMVGVFVYAATTIGDNVSTGVVTMTSASTSDDFWLGNVTADDDDYLYMDASSSEYLMWDNSPGDFVISDSFQSVTTTDTMSIGEGTAIREFNFGTCSFADRASVTASTTAYIECLNATGIASGDNIYVMATSSFDTNFIIQAASSTESNIISLRVLNTGMNTGIAEDTTLDGTTINWQSIR